MNTEKKHAKFAASNAHRWLNCAAAVSLSEKMPKPPESEYAKEGTDAHAILEAILKKEKIKKYDSTMYMFAKSAADHIHFLKARSKGELLIETKVDLSFIHKEAFGTLDAAVVEHFGRLHVIDFKYGQGYAVEVKDNPQLMFYALGVANQFDYNFEDVELTIIQPRAPHTDGPIRRHVFNVAEFAIWRETFKKAIDASEKKNPKATAGPWCKWCPAAPICPAISSQAMEQARIDFADIETQTKSLKAAVISEENWVGPELAKTLHALNHLETWISEVRRMAFDKLSRGEKISGWKLVPARHRRIWATPNEVKIDALKNFGTRAFKTEILSPTQLEKIAGKDWVAKYAISVSSGLKMVPEADPGEATNRALLDFKDDYKQTNKT